MNILHFFNLTTWQWISMIISALLIGFSKTAIGGIMMITIPLMASAFGGKDSMGILLIMLLIGDFFATWYYKKHAKWRDIRKLLLWTFVGLVIGAIIGKYINDGQFKILIAITLLVCLAIVVYSQIKGENLKVPEKAWFYALSGTACGFATMIGNAAGPILSIYLLAKGFKKNDFIGTTAWFVIIINLAKLPLQVFIWHNISINTVMIGVSMTPIIAIGALSGVLVIDTLNEKYFQRIIVTIIAISTLKLFF